jgi:hypothetical protein
MLCVLNDGKTIKKKDVLDNLEVWKNNYVTNKRRYERPNEFKANTPTRKLYRKIF